MWLHHANHRQTLAYWAYVAAAVLVVRVTISVVLGYRDYFPLNFYSEFLTGRKEYFFGVYQIAFWIHILTSPLVIFSSLWLLSSSMRRRYPMVHRRLGRVHVMFVLCLVAPTGLWMSFYALTGRMGRQRFCVVLSGTFVCAGMGWRSAMARRFAEHKIWMTRCFLLLCSAIVLRVLSGAATVMQSDEIMTYPIFAWISAVVPVSVYEVVRRLRLDGFK